MAILYIFENPAASTEIYDKVRARFENEPDFPPKGCLHHVATERDGGGLLVAEVWEDEASQGRWSERLNKVIAELGGPPRPAPRKHRVHNMQSAETARA